MKIQNGGFLSIEQAAGSANRYQTVQPSPQERNGSVSFESILQRQREAQGTADGLRFSKHAAIRLSSRNIELTEGQMERLSDGARKAGQKGIKDSLVIVDQLAFIVNVPNNTVITAMNSMEASENIFTNIDGAVIM